MRTVEILGALAGGVVGALVATLTIGASAVWVLPAVLAVGLTVVVADRTRRHTGR